MGSLWNDIRFGLRALRKSPGYVAVALLALALGIGAGTAIFSVADALLLKPANLPDTEHLVIMLEQAPGQSGNDATGVSPANFLDWKNQTKTLDEMSLWLWDSVSLTGTGAPEKVQGYAVSSNFFSIGGATPFLGRTFLPADDQEGHTDVVVLSHGFWVRRFGSDPQIVNSTIHLDGKPYTVVGVMPPSFLFPNAVELWLPLSLPDKLWARRDWRGLVAIGRMRPGIKTNKAFVEINGIEQRLGETYPSTVRGWHVEVAPIREFEVGSQAQSYIYLLLIAVGFVLLLLCANIANLQFVRGAGRSKEIAIRAALGGSRWRIVRQLLTESILLGLGGAALGLLIAEWTVRLIVLDMPAEVSRTIAGWDSIRLDWRALAFSICVAIAAGVLAGLLPALESSQVALSETLKEGGRASTSGRARHRLRNVLVILQIAFAVVLLAGAGLLVRTFEGILDANRSYRPETLMTMVLNLPASKYATPIQIQQFFDQALGRIAALPGVEGAAITTTLPHAEGHSTHVFSIEGRPWTNPAESENADFESVSPSYFRVFGVPLLRGRELTVQDVSTAPGAVVISQSLAHAYWANNDPIGHRIRIGAADDPKYPWMTIVGVVGDLQMDWTNPALNSVIYIPYPQFPRVYTSLAVRTSGNPGSFVSAIRSAIATVDPDQPVFAVKPMNELIREGSINVVYAARMMGALGVLALVLAAVGVYGVMAYVVADSKHELGIRMALGALRGNIMGLIIGRGMMLAAAGLAIGVPIAILMVPLMGSYISGLGHTDFWSLSAVSLLLAGVALAACLLPALRATRVDPITSLRHE
ncbi:MAG: ABC transporter permease [Candidatus Acidiferrales bacterium]